MRWNACTSRSSGLADVGGTWLYYLLCRLPSGWLCYRESHILRLRREVVKSLARGVMLSRGKLRGVQFRYSV